MSCFTSYFFFLQKNFVSLFYLVFRRGFNTKIFDLILNAKTVDFLILLGIFFKILLIKILFMGNLHAQRAIEICMKCVYCAFNSYILMLSTRLAVNVRNTTYNARDFVIRAIKIVHHLTGSLSEAQLQRTFSDLAKKPL